MLDLKIESYGKLFSKEVKNIIEENSFRLMKENIFLINAEKGALNKAQIICYLYNLSYIFRQNVILLDRAGQRADKMGYSTLARFMFDKSKEERGHDLWANNDLEQLAISVDDRRYCKLLPSAEKIITFDREIIDRNPHLFLGYLTFAEYFTVLVAPSFLMNLEVKCGISRSKVTAIANHQETDQHHVQDDFKFISEIITKQEWESTFVNVLKETIQLVNYFLSDCVTLPFMDHN